MTARVWCLSLVAALAHNALAVAPEIKVQALLVPCGAAPSNRSGSSTVQGFLSSKPALMACDKKLAIVLRINNTEQVEKEDLYLFVDEAVDHDSNDSVKLLEPLVVKVYQQPVVLAHAFHYLASVNGKLAEEVYAVANLSRPESLKACYSNDISAFQCGYDPDELYPKVPFANLQRQLASARIKKVAIQSTSMRRELLRTVAIVALLLATATAGMIAAANVMLV